MAFKIKKGVALRLIKGKYFVVLPEKMKLIKINDTGSFILTGIKKGFGLSAIGKKLQKKYGISAAKGKMDAEGFVRILVEEKIIQNTK